MEMRDEWMKLDFSNIPLYGNSFASRVNSILSGKKVEFREYVGRKRIRRGIVSKVVSNGVSDSIILTNRIEVEPNWCTVKYLGKRIFNELDPYGEENWEI